MSRNRKHRRHARRPPLHTNTGAGSALPPAPGGTAARTGSPAKTRLAAPSEGSDALVTVTIPLVAVIGIVAVTLCYRYMGRNSWHLIVCLLPWFPDRGHQHAAPEIQQPP